MKILGSSFIIAALALIGCKPKPESASAPATDAASIPITAAQPSAHFSEVLSHLDVGGKSLQFNDHGGRREFWIALIDGIVRSIPKEQLPVEIDAAKLLDESGLMSSAASGRSIVQEDKGWLIRSYTSYPEGLPGMMKMLGEKEPLSTGSRLPATTDISIEAQLNASILPDLMNRMGNILKQDEMVKQTLKTPTPLGASLQEVLAGMDLNILLGIDLEPTLIPQMPVMPLNVFLQISAKKELMDQLMPMLTEGLGEAVAIDQMKGWPIPANIPGMGQGVPHLVYDGTNTLRLVSSLDHLKAVLGDGKKLADEKHFQAATNHFGSSGNALVYASPFVAEAVTKWVAASTADDPDARPLNDMISSIDVSLPWAFYLSCEDKGVIGMAEVPYALDSSSVTTLTMLSATSTLFVGARAWKKGSDRAACILQTRNVQQAIRGHQNMNSINQGAAIDWNEIFGKDGYMPKPVCPTGGTYTFSEVYPETGELACKCEHADHVPTNHENW